jgi:hypothetical protein
MLEGNPFTWKREITSFPVKMLWKFSKSLDREHMEDAPMSQVAEMVLWTGALSGTVVANLYLPIKLIDLGTHGPWETVATTYKWIAKEQRYSLLPTFHTYRHPSPSYRWGRRLAGRVGGSLTSRLVPLMGWALLAYDVYDLTVNKSLWGFDLSNEGGSMGWG